MLLFLGRMEKQETDTESGNGHGKRKTTFTRSVFCANFWFMTELDASMCAILCGKLVWTVLCAVR